MVSVSYGTAEATVDCAVKVEAHAFSLGLTFLDADDRALPVVVPIDGVPASPDVEIVTNLVGVLREVITDQAPGGRAMLMLERPGSEAVSAEDEHGFSALHASARGCGVRLRGILLATGRRVRPLTPDDVGA